MALLHVSNESFNSEVLESKQPVLVDFYADWCGPCRMLAPVIEEVAQEHPDLKVVKLNVDEADEVSARYGIMSIPTVILFEGGQVAHQLVGFRSKEILVEELGL